MYCAISVFCALRAILCFVFDVTTSIDVLALFYFMLL